jgi:lysophospholipase L1-like esterase
MEPMSRGRQIGFRIASIALGVLVALLAAEALMRIFDLGPKLNLVYADNFRRSEDAALRYEWLPGSPDGALTISSAGLRDREFAIPKPEGVFRIAVLGDSVTAGSTTSRGESYPKRLESLLNTYGSHEYEVLNLGVIGYNAPQVAASLRVRGLAFEPDRVIWGYVLNDPLPSHLIAEALDAMENQARTGGLEAAGQRVRRWFAHWRLYALLWPPAAIDSADVDVEWQAPLASAQRDGREVAFLRALHAEREAWARVTTAMSTLAATSPAPPLLAIFPIRTRGGLDDYALADLHARIVEEAQERGLEALDLTGSFARARRRVGRADLFDDIVHANALGNQVAALALLQWLSRWGELPGGDQPFAKLLAADLPEARLAAALAQPDPSP